MKNGAMQVKIEKGIQLPEKKWTKKRPLIDTFEKMKDGDSFLYPMLKRTELSYCARKAGIVITTRMVNETTVRVWRIKKSLVNGSRSPR